MLALSSPPPRRQTADPFRLLQRKRAKAHAITVIVLEMNAAEHLVVHHGAKGDWASVFCIHNKYAGKDRDPIRIPITVSFGGDLLPYAQMTIRKGTTFQVTGELNYEKAEGTLEFYRIDARQVSAYVPAEEDPFAKLERRRAHRINVAVLEMNAAEDLAVHRGAQGEWASVFCLHNRYAGKGRDPIRIPLTVSFTGDTLAYVKQSIRKGTMFQVTGELSYQKSSGTLDFYRIDARQVRAFPRADHAHPSSERATQQ